MSRREPSQSNIEPHKRGRHVLLVIREDGTSTTFPLPDAGKVTIGRAVDNDVRVDDPSLSRRHAVLHIGPPMSVEDLGSANGTRVRDSRLGDDANLDASTAKMRDRRLSRGERALLDPGDMMHFGTTMAFVQQGAPAARPQRLWQHGYFDACLEKECARSERSGGVFAVLRLAASGLPADVVQEVLGGHARGADVVAQYGPSEYELLLVDADAARVDAVRAELLEALAARGGKGRIGAARYPVDGRDPESLAACAGARVAGGDAIEGRRSIVVEDPAMQRLYRMAQRIADSNITVLLLGETGAGKEVLAASIHKLSPRAAKPFLRLNCAAFAEHLLESELFGHERGAFTGATHTKQGLLETAHGGTVFLDEIGELPQAVQVKLLRVLEDRMVQHVGGLKARPVDVRFIAATNRDLEAEVERGTFREDLFFRLNGISLVIPPLRERVTEILPLARAMLVDLSQKRGRGPAPRIDDDACELLLRYTWPGNIRELRNVVERALLLSGGATITPEHLPVEKMGATLPARDRHTPPPPAPPVVVRAPGKFPRPAPRPVPPAARPPRSATAPTEIPPPSDEPTLDEPNSSLLTDLRGVSPAELRARLDQLDRERVLAALAACAGNQTQAAKMLGISRRTLVTRLEAYKVPRPRKRVPSRQS